MSITTKTGKVFATGFNADTGKVHVGQFTNRNPFWGTMDDHTYLVQTCGTRNGSSRNVLHPTDEGVTCGNCAARAKRLGLPVNR